MKASGNTRSMDTSFVGSINVPRDTSTKVSTDQISHDENNRISDIVFLKGKRRVKGDDVITGRHLENLKPCPILESRTINYL